MTRCSVIINLLTTLSLLIASSCSKECKPIGTYDEIKNALNDGLISIKEKSPDYLNITDLDTQISELKITGPGMVFDHPDIKNANFKLDTMCGRIVSVRMTFDQCGYLAYTSGWEPECHYQRNRLKESFRLHGHR